MPKIPYSLPRETTKRKLADFVKLLADAPCEGDACDCCEGNVHDIASEDAISLLNEWIREAKILMGTISICDSCKELVTNIIGCPDGAEICKACFDAGQH